MFTLRLSTFNLYHYQKTRKLLQFGTEFFTLSLINILTAIVSSKLKPIKFHILQKHYKNNYINKLSSKSIIIINDTACINYLDNNIMIGLDTSL